MRSTTAMRFVDTNVLLYAVSLSPEDVGKRRIARKLLTEPELAVSVQVLQEFYTQATRPTRSPPLTHDDALGFLEPVLGFRVHEVTLDLFHAGVSIRPTFWVVLLGRRDPGCGARHGLRCGVL